MRLIDANALIKDIEVEIEYGDEFDESDKLINKGLKIALKRIKCQPTIVAGNSDVRIKAKWLNTSNPNQLKCSNCGVIHFIGQYPSGEINWCPNCGADMRQAQGVNDE